MKVLGLDLGSKTLGVAISDALCTLARPYETFHFQENSYSQPLEIVLDILENEEIKVLVLGFPKNMNNTNSTTTKRIIKFEQILQENLQIPIVLQDERLSTVISKQIILENVKTKSKREKIRKNSIDEIAACVILQNYLDKGVSL